MTFSASFYSFLYDGSQDANLKGSFIDDLSKDKNSKIIEAHAGDGLLSINLANRGFKVTALEDDPALFAILLEKFKNRKDLNPKLTPLPINLLDLTPHQFWDTIIFSNSISFLNDVTLASYISNASTLLKKGGVLVLNSPQPSRLREEQPVAEIYKKVFGLNVIRHLASSNFYDQKSMQIRYFYEIFHANQLMTSFSSEHIIHLRPAQELISQLENKGFLIEKVFSGWANEKLESDSPNYVLVAVKNSEDSSK